jgi:hypothetical protein
MNEVARLRTARTYLRSVLLNLNLNVNEMNVGTFLEMLDHFAENPNEYREVIAKNS